MAKAMVSFLDNFPEFNGRKIQIRGNDGYINASDLNAVLGKRLTDWRKTKFAQELLDELSILTGMPLEQEFEGTLGESSQCATALIQRDLGGDQSVWLHPAVGLSYSMSNPRFQARVNLWILNITRIGVANPHILEWTIEQTLRGMEFNRDDIREMYGR